MTRGVLCEGAREGERGREGQEKVHVAAVAQLVREERERGWNRFIPRLVVLHAFTQIHADVCSFADLPQCVGVALSFLWGEHSHQPVGDIVSCFS